MAILSNYSRFHAGMHSAKLRFARTDARCRLRVPPRAKYAAEFERSAEAGAEIPPATLSCWLAGRASGIHDIIDAHVTSE
jgi:hypothetical protein